MGGGMKSLKSLLKSLRPKPADQYSKLIAQAQNAKSQSRWQEAADFYQQAYDLRESFGVMVQIGHMNKEAGRLDEAEQAYFLALAKKPDDADLNLQIGHFFYVKGDLSRSVESYRKASELMPDNPFYLDNLKIGERRLYESSFKDNLEVALKALNLGQWSEAEANFVLVHEAGSKDYLHLLGHAVKEQGRIAEAVEHYRAYYEHVKDRSGEEPYEAALLVGGTLRIAGKYSEAGSWIMKARALKMEREGWVGSVDNLREDTVQSLRRVHPALDASYIR